MPELVNGNLLLEWVPDTIHELDAPKRILALQTLRLLPSADMSIDYRHVVMTESARMLEVLRDGPADAVVPGCPGWTLADLGYHLAGVQRWSTAVVQTGQPPAPGSQAETPTDPGAVADFFAASTGPLLAALDAADPNAPCWNFTGENQTAGFWPRM